jgi:hypothetical protein
VALFVTDRLHIYHIWQAESMEKTAQCIQAGIAMAETPFLQVPGHCDLENGLLSHLELQKACKACCNRMIGVIKIQQMSLDSRSIETSFIIVRHPK